MEPKHTTPGMSPEIPRFTPPSPETGSGDNRYNNPAERAPERGIEQQPGISEQSSGSASLTPIAVLPVPPAPSVGGVAATPAAVSDTPLTANDDDVIEKEWVDKAKHIITDTKDDPYRREYEVSRLQADYLEKRYGRKLGEAA